MRKWALFAINATIIVVAVTFAVLYSSYIQSERAEMAEASFVSTMESMKQVSQNHLESQQSYVNNWGEYIDNVGMTMDEALEFIATLNSDSEISAHIVDPETLQGKSTSAHATDAQDHSIDYSGLSESFLEHLQEIASGQDSSRFLHVTPAFSNPTDGLTVIGFCTPISLDEGDGTMKNYLLLRIVRLSTIQEQWVFPTGYEDAELGLITSSGEYIVRSNAMKSENFLEFIRAYNDLTYPQRDELEQQITQSGSGVLEYKNARGQDAYWVYASLGSDTSDWLLVGYVPVEALGGEGTDWTLTLFVCGVFAVLLLIDGAYFIGLNRQLREIAKEANEANQAKTRFLSSMSHDIRTPMNAIIGMTTIAKEHLDDTTRLRDCLDKISLASEHLLTLINDVLDISKVESGQMMLNTSAFSLAEMVENLTAIVAPQAEGKHLDFQVHLVGIRHDALLADKLRLNQIFVNILSNAVKYTPEGGQVVMTLEQQALDGTDEAVRLVFTVADTGIGMDEAVIATIFQPFTRAKDSRIDSVEGSGLGLAIVKQMTDAMGGSIDVESEPGRGSTFRVAMDLPIAKEGVARNDVATGKASQPQGARPLRGLHALVAEDNDLNWEIAEELLRIHGIATTRAKDGAVCVRMLEEAPAGTYQLVLMDIQMPVMNGWDAARRIRTSTIAHVKDIPIIAMTADAFAQDVRTSLDAGMNGHVSKPIDIDLLMAEIEKATNETDGKGCT